MVERHSSSPGFRPIVAVLAGLGLLAASSATLAAANWRVTCDRVALDLQSSDVMSQSLTVASADHMSDDHGASDPASAESQDPSAPLLFLTPRVAHILQDVFGDTDTHEVSPIERVRRIMLAANAAAQAAPESESEPEAAGGDAAHDSFIDFESVILSGPMTETFYDSESLPNFQRQMYRTDI